MHKTGWVLALLTGGCLTTDIQGSQLEGAGVDMAGPASTPTANPPSGSCTLDVATLTPCCNGGAAHCVPSLPQNLSAQLQACPSGGACVPDTLIQGVKPPSCKSLNMADGVCLSVCVPQVAQYQTLLPQDVCAADERCAPCISPLDGTNTGACDIGSQALSCDPTPPSGASGPPSNPPAPSTPPAPACPYTGPPLLDPSTLPSCGAGAHCLSSSLVPAAMASKLAPCATGLCVPDPFIAAGGNFVPPSCSSIDGAEGRCLNVVLPDVAKQAATLPQASCAGDEKCVPCYSPLDGSDTGACRLSCDPGPQKPKTVLADCCQSQGKCVPVMSVPAAEQSNLGADTCDKMTQLCVPTEMLQPAFKPPTCSAHNLLVGDYTGVCLSKCLEFGLQGLAISQGDCDDQHKCAPCINPLTGKPTGAPGCPP